MAVSVSELHCSVIFMWSLASPHALSTHPVSRRNWWLCQTFSLFCGIFSPRLNKDCSTSHFIWLHHYLVFVFWQTDSSSPGAWYVTIYQPIYSRICFCCLLIFRVNVVIVTYRESLQVPRPSFHCSMLPSLSSNPNLILKLVFLLNYCKVIQLQCKQIKFQQLASKTHLRGLMGAPPHLNSFQLRMCRS